MQNGSDFKRHPSSRFESLFSKLLFLFVLLEDSCFQLQTLTPATIFALLPVTTVATPRRAINADYSLCVRVCVCGWVRDPQATV